MISDTINKKIGEALKARDEIRLSTLRMLLSALNYAKIEKQRDLNEEEELAVVNREAKKRKDAIEIYRKLQNAKAPDEKIQKRIVTEEAELVILKEYLPEEMEESELVNLVDQAIKDTGAVNIKDMGKVIGYVMGKAKGRVDGAVVAGMVRQRLV